MRIIKQRQIVEDSWFLLEDMPPSPPPDGDVIAPFSGWFPQREAWSNRRGRTTFWINGDDDLEDVAQIIEEFDLIAVAFPVFTDGRCYSSARLLRERYGFKGELRAVGNVLRDQLLFMGRCGIDSFQLQEDKDPEDALKAFDELSVKYQTATDGTLPLYKYR